MLDESQPERAWSAAFRLQKRGNGRRRERIQRALVRRSPSSVNAAFRSHLIENQTPIFRQIISG